MKIILATLNARYSHTSFGLRYLRANLGEFRADSRIIEYTIKSDIDKTAQELVALNPRVIGIGVYIWNTHETFALIQKIRQLNPEILIVVGGPEVSFEIEDQEICKIVNYVFKGEADLLFYNFIKNYFINNELPKEKIIGPSLPEINKISWPYGEYTDEDVKNRKIYVEMSRGCPYKCEYCLSSLDVSVRNFNVDSFLNEMQILLDRGVRQFKFVDRTFNLSPIISQKILNFFWEKIELGLFLHFEMVPDRLPDDLKTLIKKFPKGSLQFEIGIQTWNPEVAKNVSRRQNYQKIIENLNFLKNETGVHTHADLIVGLPGETFESFAHGFDQLAMLEPDEVQVGILKRLKGAPLSRHEENFKMIYDLRSPFEIIQNKDLSSIQMQELSRFADFWDMIANSGRFINLMQALREQVNEAHLSMFLIIFNWSKFLYEKFGRTHSIHLQDLDLALIESIELSIHLESLTLDWSKLKAALDRDLFSRNQRRTKSNETIPIRQQRHKEA